MKRFTFEGYSDDTFGTRENYGDDYDNCASGKPITWRIRSGKDSLLVTGQYCPGKATGWQVGVARECADDDEAAPAWPMTFVAPSRPYTVALQIDAPDDAELEHVKT